MTRRHIEITIDGADDEIMPVVMEELGQQMIEGAREGRVVGGASWTMRTRPAPVEIDRRQRRAAALLLMAVGSRPTLEELAGSSMEACAVCPGLTAADLPALSIRGRLDALREARSLLDGMIEEDVIQRSDGNLVLPADYSPSRDGATAFHFVDETCYPCFPLASHWNGFDNVSVSPEVRDAMLANWRSADGFDPDTMAGLASIVPGDDGRICLGWGYATTIAGPIGD